MIRILPSLQGMKQVKLSGSQTSQDENESITHEIWSVPISAMQFYLPGDGMPASFSKASSESCSGFP